MKIYINNMIGKIFELDVEPNDSIEDVKMKIQDKEGYPPDQQIIIWNSRTLKDENIREDDTLDLIRSNTIDQGK
jgi:hypothetical protein